MSIPSLAECLGCGRLIRCALCEGPVQTLPVLNNEVLTLADLPVCSACFAELSGQNNEAHPLTTKRGRWTFESALQEILDFQGR